MLSLGSGVNSAPVVLHSIWLRRRLWEDSPVRPDFPVVEQQFRLHNSSIGNVAGDGPNASCRSGHDDDAVIETCC